MKLPNLVLLAALTPAFLFPASRTLAADTLPTTSALPATQPLSKTVGIDIVKKTVNPDGSLTLLFQWKDKDKNTQSRSVNVNDTTVIGIDGQLKAIADITDAVAKKKAVATVVP